MQKSQTLRYKEQLSPGKKAVKPHIKKKKKFIFHIILWTS